MKRRTFLKSAAVAGITPLWRPLWAQESNPGQIGNPGPTAGSDDLEDVAYVDGLSFMPPDVGDIEASGLTAFVLDVSSGERIEHEGEVRFFRTYEACVKSITSMRRRLREIDSAFLATKGSDIARAREEGRTAVFFQFQGCEPIGRDLDRMDMFYELGLRVLQITHHFDNPIGGGALEPSPSGLTEFGKEAIERMNTLGILPDLSHASDPTSLDVLEASRGPVILSHGAARAIVDNARCAPDEVLRGIGESGGVVGIFMMSFWLTEDPVPTVEHVVKQARHIANVAGIDAVGIANDYSVAGHVQIAQMNNDNKRAIAFYHPWWKGIAANGIRGFERLPKHVVIPELNHVRRMETIHRALKQSAFKPDEIEKVMGGNWIRVLEQTLG